MVLYYFDGVIIGRGSGRSALGAAAYRAGGVLRSVAYRSGEELRDETGEIIHDYTRKSGVIHSQIMLPHNAPPEFADREILWNAVEARENRKDSQLAREIVVALQREFDLKEHLQVLREYIKENFTDKGMCADFSIHDKGDGNPHAHIMLTTRHVTPDGFGLKNTDWNKKNVFVEWRKGWADVNNRMFERKGAKERISHLSYKAQGLDREPMLHLGVEASAKEKKGIRTRRGDLTRERQKRNAEREAQKLAEQTQDLAEKDDKSVIDEHTAEKTAEHLNKLKEYYAKLEKDLSVLIHERNKIREELPRLTFRAESMDEHAQNIEALQNKLEELQETRRHLHFLQRTKKQETDQAIKCAEYDLKRAEMFFKNRFNINPAQTPEEIQRLQEKVHKMESDLMTKNATILEIMDTQDKVMLGYHTQKLLAETRPDHEQINQYLEKLHKPPQNIREKLLQERIDRRLNIIPDEDFQKVIEKLPSEHAKTLTHIREHHKKLERIKEKELAKIREQSKTHDLSRSR